MNDKQPSWPRMMRRALTWIAPTLLMLWILWLWRPLGILHAPLLGLYRIEFNWVPALAASLLVLAIGFVGRRIVRGNWMGHTDGAYQGEPVVWPWTLAFLSGFLVFVVSAIYVGGLRGQDIYRHSQWADLAPRALQTCQARLAPFEVWHNRANAQFTESGETLEGAHLTTNPLTGQFEVSFERAPRGFMNNLRRTTPGGAYMNVESTAPRLEVPPSQGAWKIGVTNRWSDSLDWQTAKRKYWVSGQEIVAVRLPSREQVFVAPYIRWDGLIRAPRPGGVWVLHRNGQIDDYSVAQAAKIPWLARSGHVVSEDMARRMHGSYVWRNGLVNNTPFGSKRDLIKVTDVGDANSQPYLMNMCGQGLVWATIASPQGRANAVAAMFMTSTATGKTWVVRAPRGALWIDNDRAVQVVKSRPYPGVQWSAGNYQAVEPRPLFVKGRLQYLVSIIPESGITVTKSVIVDGKDAEVVAVFNHDQNRAASDQALRTYIRTGKIAGDDQIVTVGPDSSLKPNRPRVSTDRQIIQDLIRENERQRKILQQLLERQK